MGKIYLAHPAKNFFHTIEVKDKAGLVAEAIRNLCICDGIQELGLNCIQVGKRGRDENNTTVLNDAQLHGILNSPLDCQCGLSVSLTPECAASLPTMAPLVQECRRKRSIFNSCRELKVKELTGLEESPDHPDSSEKKKDPNSCLRILQVTQCSLLPQWECLEKETPIKVTSPSFDVYSPHFPTLFVSRPNLFLLDISEVQKANKRWLVPERFADLSFLGRLIFLTPEQMKVVPGGANLHYPSWFEDLHRMALHFKVDTWFLLITIWKLHRKYYKSSIRLRLKVGPAISPLSLYGDLTIPYY